MSATKTEGLEIKGTDQDFESEALRLELENVLGLLSKEWGLEDEVTDRDIEVYVGAKDPSASQDSISISSPEAYDTMARQEFPEPLRNRALAFEGPYHEMFEESGHFLSHQALDRGTETFEDVVANEFFGGLAIDFFDEDIIPWEITRLQRNLEAIGDIHSGREVSYVNDNIDRYNSAVEGYISQLDNIEDEQDFAHLFNRALSDRKEELSNVPTEDIDYSRSTEMTPDSYSQWFVDDVVFNFLDPLIDYKQGELDLEEAVEISKAVAEKASDKISQYDLDEASSDMDARFESTSALDRGYTAGRVAARKTEDYDPQELVRMSNQEVYEEFSKDIEASDSRLRQMYGPGKR